MISVQDLRVRYNDEVVAVKGVSFEVDAGEFYTLLGPSGCGKTTTLRSIAGLEMPESGKIIVDGMTVYSGDEGINMPAHKRGLGMVFQSYAVWPHMSVFANVAYPLRYGRNKIRDKSIVNEKTMRALKRVRMQAMADRNATELSGGQQQRVALARALVHDPKVLLLDEPLSNLDAKLRAEMREELEELVRAVGTTCLYVTHDQVEALAMSDRVAVMRLGKIVQEATPRDLYERPTDRFAAGFLGDMDIIRATPMGSASADGYVLVKTRDGVVIKAVIFNDDALGTSELDVGIRPENIVIKHAASPIEPVENLLHGKMVKSVFVGDQVIVTVDVEGSAWQVRIRPTDKLPPEGGPVTLWLPPDLCIAFPKDRYTTD